MPPIHLANTKNKYLQLFDNQHPTGGDTILMAGVASPQKAFRLVWQLNKSIGLHLQRVEDLYFQHKKGEDIYIQCFEYTDVEYEYTYRLIANKTSNNILIPEHKNTNYFLLVKGDMQNEGWQLLLGNMKRMTFALTVYEVHLLDLKNKDYLYF